MAIIQTIWSTCTTLKNRYTFFPMVTSSEAKSSAYRRGNIFIFYFNVMIKCHPIIGFELWLQETVQGDWIHHRYG